MSRVQGSALQVEQTPTKRQEQPQVPVPTGEPEQKTLQNHPPIQETALPLTTPRESPRPAAASAQAQVPVPVEGSRQPVTPEPLNQQPINSPEYEQSVPQDVRKNDDTILPQPELQQSGSVLARKPSTVQEESDDEGDLEADFLEEPTAQHARQDTSHVLDTVHLGSLTPSKQPTLSSESTVVESPTDVSSQSQPSPPQQKQHENVRNGRALSSSPARSARFALGTDQLVVRHEPPPRSVSPRKSAMKHSTSPSRGASPSDESSEASGPSRFGSEATAVEAPMPRKKSVRVSFDDQNTKVVGDSTVHQELESPAPPSPQQARRHWYSHLGRNRKKDIVSLDDDEVMKPRPALPSFGSVREKKPRGTEERPLVRPVETPSPSAPDTPDRSDRPSEPIGTSNDHNVGAILNQEQTARHAANISRFREPLPPVVTSMEGSGYYSASSTTSSDGEDEPEVVQEPPPNLPPQQVKQEILAAHPELVDDAPISAAPTAPAQDDAAQHQQLEDLPSISVTQPTPTPKEVASKEEPSSAPGYFDVPGGFPEDDSEDTVPHPPGPSKVPATNKDRHVQVVEPADVARPSAKTSRPEMAVEESSSEGDSIYSDAYEDLSDVDGDGFMSLDAVVASPIPEKVSQKLRDDHKTPPAPGASKPTDVDAVQPAPTHLEPSAPSPPEDDWEKAKTYWRSLTSDKRKLLEKEALEEAGVEGDLEEVVQPKKVKRKKSVRKSEPGTQSAAPINSERTYQIQPGTKGIEEAEESPQATRKTLRDQHPQGNVSGTGKLQKTMRGPQAQPSAVASAGMRKTLRSDTSAPHNSQQQQPPSPGGMRKSMRQNGPGETGLLSQRREDAMPGSRPHSMQDSPSTRQTQMNGTKQLSTDKTMSSVDMARAMHSTLQRRASDSSESSFKRARLGREGLGFRKSMRATAETEQYVAGRNSRFSLRSMSPPASPSSPPVSMGNRTTMRSTLRSDSSDGSTRRMRLPTFGKSSAKKTGKPANKSRFGDSSDEEGVGQSAFRSRFAESSDEDEAPAPLPAAHGTPKSMRTSSSAAAAAMKLPPQQYNDSAEDSPDLPDSSDEEAVAPVQQKPLSPRKVSGASGRLVKSQSDGHGLQRSGSGRGALTEASAMPTVENQVVSRPGHQRKGSFLSVLRRKKDNNVRKISRSTLGESAARMDTKLERSPSEISALRGATASPRLHKQTMDNWPLTEQNIDDEKRPMTADNSRPTDQSRPAFMKRMSTNQVLMPGRSQEPEGGEQQPDGSGKTKKKKFGTLRRMFKLDD
ncbi:hypothetical protein CCHL11_00594 [Colletotrichum chlorophyti]|uniref:Uncharacterized protein n=1 Tax=Colletotrichum chlorophyti TaxID=708187 RepID=A0A1Q8S4J1_9PEZI|nr:hypothetical protein CCHL11_00594 [Colletotrichum chlorophyti]